MRSIIIFLIFHFIIINIVNGYDNFGTCEYLNPQSICSPSISNSTLIFISNGTSQIILEQTIKVLALSQSLDNINCRTSSLLALCSKFFPPCITKQYNTSETVYYPSLPCESLCLKTTSDCLYLNQAIGPLLNCSSKFEFPVNSTTYQIQLSSGENITEEIECNSKYIPNTPSTCPSPLAFVPVSEQGDKNYFLLGQSSCALPCPLSIDEPQKEKNVKLMTLTLHAFSFFCSILLILINGVLPNEITNAQSNILFFAIGSMLISICFFQSTSDDYFRCDGNRYIVQKDTRCGINGFFFQFGSLITIFFWTMILYDYFVTIRMKKIVHYKRYTISIWVIISILTILPMATQQFSSNYGIPNCWILNANWQLGVFYVPAMIVMALSFLFTAYIVGKIFMLYKILEHKQVLIYNIKLIVVMLVVIFDFVCIITFKFYMENQTSTYASKMENWIMCLMTSDNCKFVLPDYAIRVLQGITSSSLGIIGFLAFGIDPSVVTNFYQSKKVLWVLQKLGNSLQSNSTTTSSSGKKEQRLTVLSESTKSGVSTSSPPSRTQSQSQLNISINQSQAHLATLSIGVQEDDAPTEPDPLTEV